MIIPAEQQMPNPFSDRVSTFVLDIANTIGEWKLQQATLIPQTSRTTQVVVLKDGKILLLKNTWELMLASCSQGECQARELKSPIHTLPPYIPSGVRGCNEPPYINNCRVNVVQLASSMFITPAKFSDFEKVRQLRRTATS